MVETRRKKAAAAAASAAASNHSTPNDDNNDVSHIGHRLHRKAAERSKRAAYLDSRMEPSSLVTPKKAGRSSTKTATRERKSCVANQEEMERPSEVVKSKGDDDLAHGPGQDLLDSDSDSTLVGHDNSGSTLNPFESPWRERTRDHGSSSTDNDSEADRQTGAIVDAVSAMSSQLSNDDDEEVDELVNMLSNVAIVDDEIVTLTRVTMNIEFPPGNLGIAVGCASQGAPFQITFVSDECSRKDAVRVGDALVAVGNWPASGKNLQQLKRELSRTAQTMRLAKVSRLENPQLSPS